MRARLTWPVVLVALVVSTASACGGSKQRTLNLVDTSQNYTASSSTAVNAPCAIKEQKHWQVTGADGRVLAHGSEDSRGKIQYIQGKPTCASITKVRVKIAGSYTVSSPECPSCGTSTAYDSNLARQNGLVVMP